MSAAPEAGPRLGDLAFEEFTRRARGAGLGVRIGAFDACIRNDVRAIEAPLQRLYADFPALEGERVFSFHLHLHPVRRARRLLAPHVRLTVDGRVPHEDLPAEQALAVLEWGLNLVIALRSHNLFMLHAGAVEKNGCALILPALPGAGKTTLCAALVARGWRLLSDEFGLMRPGTVDLLPLPRPMPLKNESIELIRAFAPDAVIGPEIRGTRKGTIAHLRAPRASVEQANVSASARWIVFPTWTAGARVALDEVPDVDTFMQLATNAFNYEMLGEAGFATVEALVSATDAFTLEYSRLDDAIAVLERLARADD